MIGTWETEKKNMLRLLWNLLCVTKDVEGAIWRDKVSLLCYVVRYRLVKSEKAIEFADIFHQKEFYERVKAELEKNKLEKLGEKLASQQPSSASTSDNRV